MSHDFAFEAIARSIHHKTFWNFSGKVDEKCENDQFLYKSSWNRLLITPVIFEIEFWNIHIRKLAIIFS